MCHCRRTSDKVNKLAFIGTVTNCGSTPVRYNMRVTDIGIHQDPGCALRPASYGLGTAVPPGEPVRVPITSYLVNDWSQLTGSTQNGLPVCLADPNYVLRVDVTLDNVVLTSAFTTFNYGTMLTDPNGTLEFQRTHF